MDKLILLANIIGFYLPILLMFYWAIKQVHKRNANKEIDAKRRETFKVIKEK